MYFPGTGNTAITFYFIDTLQFQLNLFFSLCYNFLFLKYLILLNVQHSHF